ncbi:energy-coupling factor transporter transmembrane component T family protein [Nesterenkonia lacusekhoensis]|uniref:Biotin transport system permease protein n=1 Tax=Nesterenkonia lacusekhoensis TaxID=150832 RepID=A0ABS4SYM6_9MICC|nr:energy-coupling factor transporter transmembrane protein EcfT [Nesterenkonia lacusekhoensis]MBP2317299.1 biotin transport system permease protein [Nesterenkonia lacusekhoensis]
MSRRRPRPLRPRDQVFGRTAVGDGFLHRTPAWAKVAVLAAVTVTVLFLRSPTVSLGVAVGVLALGATAGVPASRMLRLLRRIWLLLAAVLAAQLVFNDLAGAGEVLSRIIACLLGAQLLILTTRPHDLLGVFRTLVLPLRWVGLSPGRIALAGLVMLRAIPYLADLAHLAHRQTQARGLERSIRARTVPLLTGSVDYARDTGRALAARGIDEVRR